MTWQYLEWEQKEEWVVICYSQIFIFNCLFYFLFFFGIVAMMVRTWIYEKKLHEDIMRWEEVFLEYHQSRKKESETKKEESELKSKWKKKVTKKSCRGFIRCNWMKIKSECWETKLEMKLCWVLRARDTNGSRERLKWIRRNKREKKCFCREIKQRGKIVQRWSNFNKKLMRWVIFAILWLFWPTHANNPNKFQPLEHCAASWLVFCCF